MPYPHDIAGHAPPEALALIMQAPVHAGPIVTPADLHALPDNVGLGDNAFFVLREDAILAIDAVTNEVKLAPETGEVVSTRIYTEAEMRAAVAQDLTGALGRNGR